AMRALASIGLFHGAKQHCWPPPFMIDAWRHPSPTRPAVWNRTGELVRDIPSSPRSDFAPHAGSAPDRWGLRAFISSARPLPIGGLRVSANNSTAGRPFISPESG